MTVGVLWFGAGSPQPPPPPREDRGLRWRLWGPAAVVPHARPLSVPEPRRAAVCPVDSGVPGLGRAPGTTPLPRPVPLLPSPCAIPATPRGTWGLAVPEPPGLGPACPNREPLGEREGRGCRVLGCGDVRAGSDPWFCPYPPPPRPAPLPRMLGVRAKGPCRPPLTPLNRELGLLPWSHSAGHGTHCCRLRDGDDPGMMVLASPKGHPGCCVWGSQVGCNQQCRDHLTRAQFGVCGEELVARAQHLCPGALQTSPPSCLGDPHLAQELLAQGRCWGSPSQAELWVVGYSLGQEGTHSLRPFPGQEQEPEDPLGTALPGVRSWVGSWSSRPPHLDPGDPRAAEPPGPSRREVPRLFHSSCAKVASSGDLSPSCRVPGGMKGHRVP